MSNKLIFIQTIPGRKTATGLSDFVHETSGKKINKTKMGRCTDRIAALYSSKVGGLANYISYTPAVDPKTGETMLNEKGEPVMLQEVLEKKWHKPAGYFTNAAWTPGDKLDQDKMTYFQRKFWELQDGSTVLDLNNMDEEMGYYVALASKYVANSEREWREHKWPYATHYIALENESDAIKYQRSAIRAKALGTLTLDLEFTDLYKRKMVSLLGIANAKATLTTENVFNSLYTFLEASSLGPGSNIEKYLNFYNLLKTAEGRERFEAMYILRLAIDTKVVFERQGSYHFVRPEGTVIIGDSYNEAIEYILAPKRAQEVEQMQDLANKK